MEHAFLRGPAHDRKLGEITGCRRVRTRVGEARGLTAIAEAGINIECLAERLGCGDRADRI